LVCGVVASLWGLFGCGDAENKGDTSALDPAQGVRFHMEVVAPPGEEVWKCQVSKLPFEDAQNFHKVKHTQTPGIHHMDLTVIVWSGLRLPPGIYDCDPLYRDNPKLMEEVILYASQTETGDILLPPGVAAEVPGGLTVMQEIHYVNGTETEQKVFSTIDAFKMPEEEVTDTIWGFAVRDQNLQIPALTRHTEWTRCVVDRDIDLLFLSTHTHELGESAEILRFDGKTTGEQVYQNDDWVSPQVKAFDRNPLHIPAGQGLEFRCHFNNERETPATYGFSAQEEMCQIAMVFTPGDPSIRCKIVETSDGVLAPL
jgi:hypothetical protein